MLTTACPSCGHRLGIPDNFAGELFRCKQCGGSFRVSAPAPAAPSGADAFGLHVDDRPAGAPTAPKPLVPLSGRGDPNSVRFSCPRCQSSFESPASQAGTKFHCSSCGQRVEVPSPPPNKTVLGSLQPLPPAAPAAPFPPPVPQPLAVNRAEGIPFAQYDAAPPMPTISVNVNTSQPYLPEPPRRRRRRRRDDEYDYQPAPSGGAGTALGITSMVLGIVALPFAILPCLGLFVLPLAGLGLLLGFLGLVVGSGEQRSTPGFAIAGLATSGVALLLVLFWFALVPDFWGRWSWWR